MKKLGMRKLIYFLITIIGGYIVYKTVDVYWMLGFWGVWFAFGMTLLKLHLKDALQLWGIVIGTMVVMMGGAVIIARQWSEFAAGVWIFICIILLMVFMKRLK